MRQALVVFSQVIYPRVCWLMQHGRRQVIWFFRQTYFPFLMCVIGGCGLVFILAPQILHLFIGNKSVHSLFLLRVMCLVVIIICMNIPACLVLLAANGKKGFLKIIMIGTFLNITSNIVLVQFFDEKGTAFSIVITELFITVGLYWEVYRMYIRNKSEHESFLKLFFVNR
jgi:PST family polysaccharide transporter